MRLVLLAVAAAMLLPACSREPDARPEEIRPVRVVRIGPSEAVRSFEAAGEVRARHETRLAFRVGGKIVERLVETGSVVRAGQPIARLDPADLVLAEAGVRAQEAGSEAERDLAEAELKRYRELRAKNFVSQAELDRRASTLATAEARLAAVRAQRRQLANQSAYTVLTADTAGVIVAIEAEAGQVVAAGQTVARLARPGEKEIAFAVPESERDFFARAAGLSVSLGALPGRSWQARLRELSPAAEPATRTYPVRASILDAGADVELGMSARITARASGDARIEVPIAAIHSRDDRPQVFLVTPDGTVQPRPVRTAGIANERVVIESGLAAGDVVVAAGAQLLRPGQRVRVLEER
jgi:multidrug efflux system membrane fusion protein